MLRDLFRRAYPQYESSPHAAEFEGFASWLVAGGRSQKAVQWCCRRLRRALAVFDQPVVVFSSERLRGAFAQFPRRGFVGTGRLFRRYLVMNQRLCLDAPCEPRLALKERYLERLVRLRGLAPATVTYDGWALNDFLKQVLRPDQLPSDLTPGAIDAFFTQRRGQLARRTFRHSVGVVRSFLRYAFECGAVPRPLHGFELPKAFRFEQPPRALRWSDVEALLGSIDGTTPLGCRDHAILHLMSHYGLRPGEVASLALESIDREARTLRVAQSKTHSTLTLPLSAQTLRLLREYLDRARPHSRSSTLFVTMDCPHAAMTASAVSARFKAAARRSGSPVADASAYALRHTFAMRLLGRGVGIKSIGDLMGHHSLASTSAYLRIQTDMLRGVALDVPMHGVAQ